VYTHRVSLKKNPPFWKRTKTGSFHGLVYWPSRQWKWRPFATEQNRFWCWPVLTRENGGHFKNEQNRFLPGFAILTPVLNSENGGHFATEQNFATKPVLARVLVCWPVLTEVNSGHFDKEQNRFLPGFCMLTLSKFLTNENGGHFEKEQNQFLPRFGVPTAAF
jgi:hypothetical protein